MASTIVNTFIFILVTLFVMNVLGSLGDFGFPEASEKEKSKQNAANKKPVFLPLKCNENELFYPGDQNDDWVCDCKPVGQYVPECIPNRCNVNGVVSFKNSCHSLDKAGPCELPELSFVVGVNTKTLELECIRQNQPDVVSRFGEEDNEPTTENPTNYTCLRGSKRAIQGKC